MGRFPIAAARRSFSVGFLDPRPFDAVPKKTLDRAVLFYREQASPRCMSMVYTQGGFLVDPLPCWTDGDGKVVQKANGCLSLQAPNEDWLRNPPADRPVGWSGEQVGIQRAGPSAWEVTGLFRLQHIPTLGGSPASPGYILIGEPLFTRNLSADDNTRCTSQLSDFRLSVTYTVPPIVAEYEVRPPR